MKRGYGVLSFTFIALIVFIIGALFVINKTSMHEAGLQVGIGGGPGVVSPSDDSSSVKNRSRLNQILQQHVAVGAIHLQNFYDSRDTSSTKSMMDKNTNDLMNLVSSYNPNSSLKNNFEMIWMKHMELYEAYTKAVKDKDPLKASEIKQSLHKLAQEFGNTGSQIFPGTSSSSIADAMTEHIDLTLSVVDAYSQKDENTRITQAAKSTIQASRFAEVLVP